MTIVHIYRARFQRATKYKLELGGKTITIRNSPHRRIGCMKCGKMRIAANLVVQSYFDGDRFFCVEGKGCRK